MGTAEKVATAVAECRRLGIAVLRPDINRSQASFSIEHQPDGHAAIRFGLAAIKNVGSGAIEPAIAERARGGPFKSVEDLSRRADFRAVNRRVLESLIRAGALDDLGERGTLLNSVAEIMSLAQREQRLRESGQATMFDFFGQAVSTPLPALQLKPAEVDTREKSQWEKELLGVALSRQFAASKKDPGMIWPSEIDAEMDGQSVSVVGEISSVTQLFTRDRKAFVKAVIEDISGSIETMVWPRVYEKSRELWQEGNAVVINGKVRMRDDSLQLNCDEAMLYVPSAEAETALDVEATTEVPRAQVEPAAAPATEAPIEAGPQRQESSSNRGHRLIISLGETGDADGDITRLHKVFEALKEFNGEDEVRLRLNADDKVTYARLPVSTSCCPELQQRLEAIVGMGGVSVEDR